MKKVYFLSGLGADSRTFKFLDLSFCTPHFIDWIAPLETDTLASYAERLFNHIGDEEATVVGMSFGGMLATEIAKNHPRTNTVIISSSKTYREIPRYLRMWRYLPLYKLHSHRTKKYAGGIVLNIIGTKAGEQKKVQQEILRDTDPVFTRWAIDAILKWRNTVVPQNLVHIHGTADKMLPYWFVKPHYTIRGGEHTMVMDKADEVTQLLKQLIL